MDLGKICDPTLTHMFKFYILSENITFDITFDFI